MAKTQEEFILELNDNHAVKVLICYLLKNLVEDITEDELYEIAVAGEIINYFHYSEAMETLFKTGAIEKIKKNGTEYLAITPKGSFSVDEFKRYVPRSFRDKLMTAALLFFARRKREKEVICKINEAENGYYVEFSVPDATMELISLKLYAPDKGQAELLRENIMLNPMGLYWQIVSLSLKNTEKIPKNPAEED